MKCIKECKALLKYLKNEKGEVGDLALNPYMLLLLIVIFICFFTLLLQYQMYNTYNNLLDELADVYIRKPMEEEGGFKKYMQDEFEDELKARGIDVNKVKLVDATRYPVDRGEPVEVLIESEFEIKALAYIGGPIIKRPVYIREIGVSQKFFR